MAGGRLAAKPRRRVMVAAPARKRAPVRRAVPAMVAAAPRERKVRGEAGEAFRSGGTTLGGLLGTALGGPAGGAVGSMLGRGAGAMISKIFGHGDYQVSNAGQVMENSIVLSNAAQAPSFGSGRVSVKFKHREFLGDVYSSPTASTFKIESYPINPGLDRTFPWLSGVIGAKFQQYRINGMTFEFRSMSADALNSTNTALGSVIMSTDYDSADDHVFASKQEMENTEYGVSAKPSSNMLHAIECARGQTPVSELYIRAFDVPSGKDIRLYDLGRFSIASTGCQGTSVNLGELWVSYDIDAFKAIEQVPGYLMPFSDYALTGAGPTAPLGTAQTQLVTAGPDNQIELTFTENKISWTNVPEVGTRYSIFWALAGAAAYVNVAPVISTGNGMLLNGTTAWQNVSETIRIVFLKCDVSYAGGGSPDALPYLNIADFTWTASTTVQGDLHVRQISGLLPGTYADA